MKKKLPPWFEDWRAEAVGARHQKRSLLDEHPEAIALLHELITRGANGEGTVPIKRQWEMLRDRFKIKIALMTVQHFLERRWPELYEKAHAKNSSNR